MFSLPTVEQKEREVDYNIQKDTTSFEAQSSFRHCYHCHQGAESLEGWVWGRRLQP
jgi:hypothetical protein